MYVYCVVKACTDISDDDNVEILTNTTTRSVMPDGTVSYNVIFL